FDIHFAVGRPAALGEHLVGLVDDRLADAFGLGHGVDTGDQAAGGAAEASRIGGADRVRVGWRQAAGAADVHAVLADLLQLDLGDVAGHVRQRVGTRVADFVEHLLADGEWGDQAAGVFRLGQYEAAIGLDFQNRETDVLVVRHVVPVGEVATGALGATFHQVTGEGGLGQLVVIVPLPAEFMHQRAADHGAVDHAAGDDDVGTLIQRGSDAGRTQVGIERYAHGRHRRATEHFRGAGLGQLASLALQAVAMQYGDFQVDPGLLAGGGHGGGAGSGVDATGVADNADLLGGDLAQQG